MPQNNTLLPSPILSAHKRLMSFIPEANDVTEEISFYFLNYML